MYKTGLTEIINKIPNRHIQVEDTKKEEESVSVKNIEVAGVTDHNSNGISIIATVTWQMNGFNLEKGEDPKQSHDSGLGKVVAEQEA